MSNVMHGWMDGCDGFVEVQKRACGVKGWYPMVRSKRGCGWDDGVRMAPLLPPLAGAVGSPLCARVGWND